MRPKSMQQSLPVTDLNTKRRVFASLVVLLGLLNNSGCAADEPSDQGLSPILQSMPTNSEQRCVGIASVTEALLEGKRVERSVSIDEFARSLHQHLSSEASIEYPSQIQYEGVERAIEDKVILEQLSKLVADLYKQETSQAWESRRGAERLTAAHHAVVRNQEQLQRIFDNDPDNTECFCCFGERRFPDGTYKETYHAAVFRRTDQGEILVFDSNDPGKPIDCKLQQTGSSLTAEWTCQYRDTGMRTTQRYELVPMSTFFRIARGQNPAPTDR